MIKSLILFFLLCFHSYGSDRCLDKLKSVNYQQYENKHSKNFSLLYNHKGSYMLKSGEYLYTNESRRAFTECNKAVVLKKNPKRIALMSSTLLEVFYELNIDHKIVGVGDKKYVYRQSQNLKNAKDLGTIPSVEKIFSIKPDVLIGYDSPALKPFYLKCIKLGIKVIAVNDYLERHPLARAELRVLIGAIAGSLDTAVAKYEQILGNYNSYKKSVTQKRGVLLGSPTSDGLWKNVSVESDFYKIVLDAGGFNVISSLEDQLINPEKIFKYVEMIEYWLPQKTYLSRKQIMEESNFTKLLLSRASFEITTYTKKMNNIGGAEYWDVAMMRPDLLLFDLINVLETSKDSDPEKTRWYQLVK